MQQLSNLGDSKSYHYTALLVKKVDILHIHFLYDSSF